jgi:hypothetical protein
MKLEITSTKIWLIALVLGYLIKGIPMVGALLVGWIIIAKLSKIRKKEEQEEQYYDEY